MIWESHGWCSKSYVKLSTYIYVVTQFTLDDDDDYDTELLSNDRTDNSSCSDYNLGDLYLAELVVSIVLGEEQ